MRPLRFTEEDAHKAYDEWGCNCGPTALAAIMGSTLDEARKALPGFDDKHYTNPTMMFAGLDNLKAKYTISTQSSRWPKYGLVRVQWEGPWTNPGVPIRARYRHTHWVAAQLGADGTTGIFDCNSMPSGGWIGLRDWMDSLVPWILENLVPRNNGKFHLTHIVEIAP